MASIITHPIIPLTAGLILGKNRISWQLILVGMLGAILPDLDVIGFHFDVQYESPFGHRGFSHSLTTAAGFAVIASLFARNLCTDRKTVFIFTFFATASHGILDALTTGGLGVAFFWPFSEERFFFPIRCIRVSPIGVSNFMSARGLTVLRSEFIWVWLPCFAAIFVSKLHFLRKAST